jgi:hypothetical protein
MIEELRRSPLTAGVGALVADLCDEHEVAV